MRPSLHLESRSQSRCVYRCATTTPSNSHSPPGGRASPPNEERESTAPQIPQHIVATGGPYQMETETTETTETSPTKTTRAGGTWGRTLAMYALVIGVALAFVLVFAPGVRAADGILDPS